MAETATLSTRFQITIPKALREARQWKAGQKFAFVPKGAGVMLTPVPEAAELRGIARGAQAEDVRDRDDRC
jgi:AbrB family looped-hinge helix DNA binding protein